MLRRDLVVVVSVLLALFFCFDITESRGQGIADSLLSEPLRAVYQGVELGMRHTEADAVIRKHTPPKRFWGIHERDLSERSDLWDVHLEHYPVNIFVVEQDQNFVMYDLVIYFDGIRVGCLILRHWADGVKEELKKGDKCHYFNYQD